LFKTEARRARMKSENKGDLGRSKFNWPLPRLSTRQKVILAFLLILAFSLSMGADLWPGKKTYFWAQRGMVSVFVRINHIEPAYRYNRGHSPNYPESLYYLLLVKLFRSIFSERMLALRMISIISSLISIYLLYLIARTLFCSSVALMLAFLLSTSPIYLESMRAYGYIPFSMLIFVLTIYIFITSFNNRLTGLKLSLLALCVFISLALYVPLRLVAVVMVLFWLCYFKSEKKKLLVFAVLFLMFLALSDALFRDTHFNWGMGLVNHPEWFKYTGGNANWRGFLNFRLIPNLYSSFRSFTNLGTIPFADEEIRSRLFNLFYTPFFFIGLLICLKKRRRSDVLLLLWIAITYLSTLASSNNYPRRVIASLPAIYIIISLGIWWFYNFIINLAVFSRRKIIITIAGVIFLAIAAGWDLNEYIFSVSKPYYNYSREQLETVGNIVNQVTNEGGHVVCNVPTRDLIWGNPYFINHFRDPKTATRASPWHPRLRELKKTVLWALENNKKMIYLYTFPQITPRYGSKDYARLFKSLADLKSSHRDRLIFSQIPGTEMRFVSTFPVMNLQSYSK